MDEPGGERLVREGAGWMRASFLELLFDLVFVFALNQVSLRLVDDFSTGHELLIGEAAPTCCCSWRSGSCGCRRSP
ncbi:low temperature requirement protein A [Micromonospora sp. 4G55]|uniref:low temperature requirement protein A n=1 Tax=Micromonospora sp. 4G55 TaxID=2806102 RepID=UPI001A533424|nr:low temperature requirement protein A [Micromonospora sp. 4G55]MBM0255574.1 low temperature requirement protein A [Micromonospora sp. 4G55]